MAGRIVILGAGTNFEIGSYGKKDYLRRFPGHPEGIAAKCKKPHYTKAQKRKMAQRPQVQRFCQVNAEAHAIWHNPELKAEWAAKHKAARQDASRHNYYVPVRLWDYIRHEINLLKIEAEQSI